MNYLSNYEVPHKNTGLFRFSHFCAPQINAAVSCDLTRRGGEALGNRVRYNQSNILFTYYFVLSLKNKYTIPYHTIPYHTIPYQHRRWSPDMSAPQHIGVRTPTGRLSGVREQTCRLPSKLSLGSRHTSAVWRSGADLSAPQQIVVGEPTGRFPRTLPLGARHVGSLDTATMDSDGNSQVSASTKWLALAEPTCNCP